MVKTDDGITLRGWPAILYIFGHMIVALLVLAIPTYFIMLALGALHSVNQDVPAVGFWTTYICVVALRLLINLFRVKVR